MSWFEFSCINYNACSLWIVIYTAIVGNLTRALSTNNKTNKSLTVLVIASLE